MNDDLRVKRRSDLEDSELEVIWLEVCPFKSHISLFVSGIYRPPSFTKEDDVKLEKDIEMVFLMDKETILLADFNVNYHNNQVFKGTL